MPPSWPRPEPRPKICGLKLQNRIDVKLRGPSAGTIIVTIEMMPVDLRCNKQTGATIDVVCTWNGTGPTFTLFRGTEPTLTLELLTLVDEDTVTGYTDVGAAEPPPAAAKGDDAPDAYDPRLALDFFYVASEPGGPQILSMISPSPIDTLTAGPTGTADPTTYEVCVNGIAATIVPVGDHVNFFIETSPPTRFVRPKGVPVALGVNTLRAIAKDDNENYGYPREVFVTRIKNNNLPQLVISPQNGMTTMDATPLITVAFSDADSSSADPNCLRVTVDGVDRTYQGSITGNLWSWQVLPIEPLATGSHSVFATICESTLPPPSPRGANAASSNFLVVPPQIFFINPEVRLRGESCDIAGIGFGASPGCLQDIVKFGGVATTPIASCSDTQLNGVVVPSTALVGPVTVEVEGQISVSGPSAGIRIVLWTFTNGIDIRAITVNPQSQHHVQFNSSGNIQELRDDGTSEHLDSGGTTGPARSASGDLYSGTSTNYIDGPIYRWSAGSRTSELYSERTRIVVGDDYEAKASTDGVAVDAGGTVYVYDKTNNRIKRVVDSMTAVILARNVVMNTPPVMVIDWDSATLYFTSGTKIKRMPTSGGAISEVPSPSSYTSVSGLDVLPGGRLLVSRGYVSVLDPGSGRSWDLGYGLDGPIAFGVDAQNKKFIVGANSNGISRLQLGAPIVRFDDNLQVGDPAHHVIDFPSTVPPLPPHTIDDCTNLSYIDYVATFDPPEMFPEGDLITWTLVDPDDPSSDNSVDPNGPAGDDNATRVGTGQYTPWEMYPGFPITGTTTAVSVQTPVVKMNSVLQSKIRVHPSCHPGDDMIIRASGDLTYVGNVKGESSTVTTWRRVHLETASMGPYEGQDDTDGAGNPDLDDALMADVPDPPGLEMAVLMNSMLRPAYVEVAPFGSSTNPGVKFKHHIEFPTRADPTPVNDQVDLGRVEHSDGAHWAVTIQGAYEGPEVFSNDPDNPAIAVGPNVPGVTKLLGITDRAGGDSSLSYAEVSRDSSSMYVIDENYVNLNLSAHEVFHQFGLNDPLSGGPCGIMSGIPTDFPRLDPVQIRFIRSIMRFPQSHDHLEPAAACGP